MPPEGAEEECGQKCFGYYLFNRLSAMSQISPFLSRHGLRRATLSPGEGLGAVQLFAKLEFVYPSCHWGRPFFRSYNISRLPSLTVTVAGRPWK